mmetsp:Transcript_15224/g.22822  ORF Transcript_15224/g.22822 Transcript_15224/m.22822 type:complete len:139 (+) Transcript_15224:236-652(+)
MVKPPQAMAFCTIAPLRSAEAIAKPSSSIQLSASPRATCTATTGATTSKAARAAASTMSAGLRCTCSCEFELPPCQHQPRLRQLLLHLLLAVSFALRDQASQFRAHLFKVFRGDPETLLKNIRCPTARHFGAGPLMLR